jgi:hypothetical protein
LSLFLALLLVAQPAPDVAVLRWTSPDNSQPLTYRAWRSSQTAAPFAVKPLRPATGFQQRVDFLVEASLAESLSAALDTLAADLAAETCAAAFYSVSGNSPESLKAFLVSEYQDGMVSAVLVGDLPVAWFQLIDDWNSNGVRDPGEGYEEFPCDLFFMDLDNDWYDSMVRLDTLDSLVPGSDSIYDIHTGQLSPEIAVSRLPVSSIGNATTLLRQYFGKNHAYRTGQMALPDRALVYIDDDWVPNAAQWYSDVGLLYPDRDYVVDPETTRIAHYQPLIDSGAYQWVALMSHSWPGGHAMKYDSGTVWDWFYANNIHGIDPEASFYNLFACSNVRFVENGYCGGCYVFQTTTGLGAIGSAKTGSMLNFQYYYQPLADGAQLGEAFRQWFDAQVGNGCQPWERAWFYGMCYVGDGSLRPRLPQAGIASPSPAPQPGLGLSVMPNPFSGTTTVSFKPQASSRKLGALRVFDAQGRVVQTSLDIRTSSFRLDLGSMPAGVYFVAVESGASRARIPLTVVR